MCIPDIRAARTLKTYQNGSHKAYFLDRVVVTEGAIIYKFVMMVTAANIGVLLFGDSRTN
jgi:hypothetical protein